MTDQTDQTAEDTTTEAPDDTQEATGATETGEQLSDARGEQAPPEGTAEVPDADDDEVLEDETGADHEGDEQEDAPVRSARKEAAKYRRQLRDAQAEAETLRTELDTVRWGVVRDGLRSMKSTEPLQAAGYTLESFTRDDGTVDTAAVRRIESEYATKIGLQVYDPREKSIARDLGKKPHSSGTPSWSQALRR